MKRGGGQLELTACIGGERTVTAVVPRSASNAKLAHGAQVVVSFGPEAVLLVRVE